jgi:hypothetical protein
MTKHIGTCSLCALSFLIISTSILTLVLFDATCSKPPQPLNQESLELAISAIDKELSTLSLEEESIRKVHIMLEATRDSCKMVAPIHSLPAEILTRIFLEPVYHHAQSNQPLCPPLLLDPTVLSSVCRLWRQLAVNCRLLWAHLRLVVGGSYNIARHHSEELWAERSQGAPLHLHICQGTSYFDSDSDDDDDPDERADSEEENSHPDVKSVSKLLPFITPLKSQIRSLELVLSGPCQYLLSSLLNELITPDVSDSNSMKMLRIKYDLDHMALEFQALHPLMTSSHYSSDCQAFFSSLEVLDLRNITPPWYNMTTLGNLVDLRLEARTGDQEWSVTQAELAAALESCPKLRSLVIVKPAVARSPKSDQWPVRLNELRTLSLRCLFADDELELALSIIAPGPYPLTVRLDFSVLPGFKPGCLDALRSFCDRSNIATLYGAGVYIYDPWFASEIGTLPRVQTLALQGCYFSDSAHGLFAEGVPITIPNPSNPTQALWPQLQNLYLYKCRLDKDHLCRLLSLHSIQTLRLKDCGDILQPHMIGHELFAEYEPLLSQYVPDVGLYVEDEDASADWSFSVS